MNGYWNKLCCNSCPVYEGHTFFLVLLLSFVCADECYSMPEWSSSLTLRPVCHICGCLVVGEHFRPTCVQMSMNLLKKEMIWINKRMWVVNTKTEGYISFLNVAYGDVFVKRTKDSDQMLEHIRLLHAWTRLFSQLCLELWMKLHDTFLYSTNLLSTKYICSLSLSHWHLA